MSEIGMSDVTGIADAGAAPKDKRMITARKN